MRGNADRFDTIIFFYILIVLIGIIQSSVALILFGSICISIILIHNRILNDPPDNSSDPLWYKQFSKYTEKDFDSIFCMFIEISSIGIYHPLIPDAELDDFNDVILQKIKSLLGNDSVCRFSENQFVVIQDISSVNYMDYEERVMHQTYVTDSLYHTLSDLIAVHDQKTLKLTRMTIGTASHGVRYRIKSIGDLIELANFTKRLAFEKDKDYLVADDSLRANKSDIDEFRIGFNKKNNSMEEINPFFQPVIDLNSNRIVGCESFARWQKDKYRLIEAEKFIRLAQEMNLFSRIDRAIISKTFAFMQSMRQNNLIPGDFMIVINISKGTLMNISVAELVVLAGSNSLRPEQIELDIQDVIFAHEDLVKKVYELRTAKFRIALDQFNSNTFTLKSFFFSEFDTIKINKVKLLATEEIEKEKNFELYNMIIEQAKTLNIKTMIKGVENRKEFELTKLLKVDYIQGIYFTPPISNADFCRYLKKYHEGIMGSIPIKNEIAKEA